MFEMFYWSSIVDAVAKLPKEAIVGAAVAYVVIDIHKRNTEVKVAEAKAKVRLAELEVEALELKRQMRGQQ